MDQMGIFCFLDTYYSNEEKCFAND